MSENITFTRISELPENGQSNMPVQMGGGGGGMSGYNTNVNMNPNMLSPSQPSQTGGFDQYTYQTMNVHPNPYGFPTPPPGGMPLPQQQMKPNQQIQQEMYTGGMQHTIPSRDIPMDTTTYTHDDQIRANYIPPTHKNTTDYILDYEENSSKHIQKYEKDKKDKKMLEAWFDEFHLPIFICVLYFVFQLPIVNTIVFRRFSFLSIYNDDGQFNVSGLVLKSVLFGGAFYIAKRSVDFISEL